MVKTFSSDFNDEYDFKRQAKRFMNYENQADWHDIFSDKKQKEKSRRQAKKSKNRVADWGY